MLIFKYSVLMDMPILMYQSEVNLRKKHLVAVFLGYANNVKGYCVYKKESGKIEVSRTVQLSK